VVLALIAAAALLLWYEHREVKTLTQQTGADANVISQQDAAASNAATTIQDQQTTAVITDQTQQNIATTTQDTNTQQQQVNSATTNAINSVDQQYSNQPAPATPAQATSEATAESKAISTIQINSLWQTYCDTATDPSTIPQCAQYPSAASAAQPQAASQ
jgi:hypothetical protein